MADGTLKQSSTPGKRLTSNTLPPGVFTVARPVFGKCAVRHDIAFLYYSSTGQQVRCQVTSASRVITAADVGSMQHW